LALAVQNRSSKAISAERLYRLTPTRLAETALPAYSTFSTLLTQIAAPMGAAD
jgi:hypothetical protein